MPRFDLPLEDLRSYAPQVREPRDFDVFWTGGVAQARALGGAPQVRRLDSPLTGVAVHELTFPGFAGDSVLGWYLRPAGTDAPLATIVEFVGYGAGRGLPHERLAWPVAGYAYVVMDTRGQGSAWGGGGVTDDPHGAGPAVPGFTTRGIEDPADYYYRRVFIDAVRCVDAVRLLDGVDPARLVVTGISQGGGIALAVAGLRDDLAGALVDVPFCCHFERAVGLTDADPYAEIARYLAVHRDRVDQVFDTLSYMDGVSFAARASAPALFSTALLDPICPPSTVFAAYNRYAGPKDITVYPFNDHEGGGVARWPVQERFVRALLGG
ncbi:acetylxylan esterase [Cellulomonas citrea]|uniref:acetylxylan esterase n=1 Tax=Cellulomonas citrea TaxID=1909423 RepID=UPI00135710D7|nr:acetylxylan esterase [Cellulomonas citrea]